jgi:Kef-type K+ transport system membrane component KefB
VAAVLGKQACALGALGTRLSGVTIGLGMIPRGEVGLIFANIGLALQLHGEPVIDARVYAAVITVVMATTLITPPALRWSLTRGDVAGCARSSYGAAAERDSSPTTLTVEGSLTEQSAAVRHAFAAPAERYARWPRVMPLSKFVGSAHEADLR